MEVMGPSLIGPWIKEYNHVEISNFVKRKSNIWIICIQFSLIKHFKSLQFLLKADKITWCTTLMHPCFQENIFLLSLLSSFLKIGIRKVKKDCVWWWSIISKIVLRSNFPKIVITRYPQVNSTSTRTSYLLHSIFLRYFIVQIMLEFNENLN